MELSSIAVFDEDDGHQTTYPPVERKSSAGKWPNRPESHPLPSERRRNRDHRVEETPERDGSICGSESSGSESEADVLRGDPGHGEAAVAEEREKGTTAGVKPTYTRILKRTESAARTTA